MSVIEQELKDCRATYEALATKFAALKAQRDELLAALERIHTWLICPALDRDTLQEMQTFVGNALASTEGRPS